MKKHLISAALLLLLLLSIPVAASADVIYPTPEDFIVGEEVDHLLATLDPGGTVWTNPDLLPEGLRIETEETESAVQVYLRGRPQAAGTYDLVIAYNGSSSICTLHIVEPELISLDVEALPEKTEYTAGETLDPQGLILRGERTDGGCSFINRGYSLYPTRLETAGTQRIEVSYQGKLCYFDVEVAPAPEVIEGIGVLTMPEKVVYEPGESLEPEGLSIRVYTNNGTRDVSWEELLCSPETLEESGAQLITVEYGGKTCTFTVTVQEPEAPASLTISRLPDKLDYTVGEELDTSGMVLLLTDDGNEPAYLDSGFVCDPVELDEPGNQVVVVHYGELDCQFQIRVSEETPRPVEPAPETPRDMSPAAEPALTPETAPDPVLPADLLPAAPEEPSSLSPIREPISPAEVSAAEPQHSGSRLAAVIVFAAILALGVLGVYVFLVNRSGKEYFAGALRDLFRRRR